MKLPLVINTHGSVPISATLDTRICVFTGDSGTGKTFLFSLLSGYCDVSGLSMAIVDSNNLPRNDSDIERLISYCSGVDIVALDNANLYDVNTFVQRLQNSVGIILVSGHNLGLDATDMGYYQVSLSNSGIIVKRLGGKMNASSV